MSKPPTTGSSKPQKDRERREDVTELKPKLVGLKELKNCTSTEAFIAALEAALPQYRGRLKRPDLDRMAAANEMSGTYEEAIGTFCSFDWDPNRHGDSATLWRSGTAQAFLKHLFQPAEAQSGTIIRRAPGDIAVSDKNGLASVEALLGNAGKGQVDLGFEASCAQSTPLLALRATIGHAVLTVDCGRAVIDRETRKGFGQPLIIQNGVKADISVAWSAGTSQRPRWALDAGGKPLGNFTLERDFMRVVGMAPGDRLTVSLGVYRPDIGEADGAAAKTSPAAPADDVIALALQGGAELSPEQVSIAKRRFLHRIAADAISNDGRILTLATHTIRFIAQDDKS